MRAPRTKWTVAIFALLLATGCGKASIGMECDGTSDCESGLSCLRERVYDPGTGSCRDGAKYCSVSCSSDAECTEKLGPGHICVGDTGTFVCPPGLCFEGSSSGG
jgi:hypothetical protein